MQTAPATTAQSDLVIGLLVPSSPESIHSAVERVHQSVAQLYAQPSTLILPPDSPLLAHERILDPAESLRASIDSVFAAAADVHARAIAIIVSDLDHVTPQWIYGLIRPILELDFDLVTPCYTHSRFEGLLNASIIAPLTRALYGRRVQHPLGPDFAFSSRLARYIADHTPQRIGRSLASLTLDAICNGFEICQSNLGPRRYPPTDWMNQSSILVQVLDPIFRELDRRAPFWQRVRGSQPVPAFGPVETSPEPAPPPDTHRMLESFQLACRNLRDVWAPILPPGTLLELSKLSRQPAENFHLPDPLWSRIIYDFALAHHLRILNADHLLRAMTPLFLAWVASYAQSIDPDPLESLAVAFEQSKPYALSRWRWPDRFNP